MTGVERLVKLIVCHGMQHFRVHPAVIFAVDHLAHEPESGFMAEVFSRSSFMNPKSRYVRAVQADPVDIEVVDPELDRVKQILADLRVPEI